MSRNDWHILHEEGALTMSRHLPVQFDLSVQAVLPRCGKGRLALQIRQDMWRALQSLRGFSPAVRIEDEDGRMRVTAGGRVPWPFPKAASEGKLRELLSDRKNRSRWVAFAGGCCYE